jgi:HAD superfamily hydrolase (TIGR01509 family)
MAPPAVILDVDGTLVDSNYHHALTWHRAFVRHGLQMPAWRTHRSVGMGGDMLVPALAGEQWAAEHGDAVKATEGDLYQQLIGTVAPLPGARPFLEALRERGHAVVLSSSAKAEELEVYLDLLDARDLVDGWTTSADVERTKPEPDVIEAGLEKLGHPDRSVVVGDSIYDVQAAHAAGVPTIALLTGGFGAAELEETGAAEVHEDLVALREAADGTALAG